jgi:hypothetical protein
MKKLIILGIVIFTFLSFNRPAIAQVDLYLDEINVYVNTWGKISIYTLPDTIRQIYQATVLVGTGPNSVFDYYNDADPEDSTQLLSSPTFGDYEIYGSYNNNFSGAPPDVLEKQYIYCWQDQNSIIVKHTIINRELNSIDAVFGYELVPEIAGTYSGGDTVTYSSLSKIISVRKGESVGFKPLSGNFKSLGALVWNGDYRVDSTYYHWLTYNSFDSLFIIDPNDPNVDSPWLIPAYNSTPIASGDSLISYFAIAYGENEAAMQASMEQAQQKYNELITAVETDLSNIPSYFVLEQNYPNPFNPSTAIKFSVPKSGFVLLKVYDLLGKEVATLVSEELAAGNYQTTFEGSTLPSGVYFYTLKTSSFIQTKKMNLIK